MRLEELVTVERAAVYADSQRVGVLFRTPLDVQFTYDPGYAGPPLATTLPVRAAPFSTGRPGAVPVFFAGLLPEGRRLTALRRAAKTSADDDLTLLLAVGEDTIGHARILPDGALPAPELEVPVIESFTDVRFDALFARVLAREPEDRVGLPGVQDKVSGRMISVPLSYSNTGWILKLDPPEYPHLVTNEAFFLEAARLSGLPVPNTEVVHDATGAKGLLIRRFDRQDGRRLPQEDGCQVAGVYPAEKYRMTTETLVERMSSVCGAPIVAARDLLRQLVFAYLICNGDAHAKNFSVIRSPAGEWSVTPAYDLPSSRPYGDTTMALSVCGKTREDIGRQDYLTLAAAVGVRQRAASRVIDDLLAAVPRWVDAVDNLPFDGAINHKLKRAIKYRAQRLTC